MRPTRTDRATRRCYHPRDDVGRGPAGRALVPEPDRCDRGRAGRRVDEGAPRGARRRRLHRRAAIWRRGSRPVRHASSSSTTPRSPPSVALTSTRPGNVVAELVLATARRRAATAPVRRAIVRRGGRRGRAHHRRDARSDAGAQTPIVRRLSPTKARTDRAPPPAEKPPIDPRPPPRPGHQRRPRPSKPPRRPRRVATRADSSASRRRADDLRPRTSGHAGRRARTAWPRSSATARGRPRCSSARRTSGERISPSRAARRRSRSTPPAVDACPLRVCAGRGSSPVRALSALVGRLSASGTDTEQADERGAALRGRGRRGDRQRRYDRRALCSRLAWA